MGGLNATALTKFLQNDHIHEKMALVSDGSKFVNSDLYFLTAYGVIKDLKLESASINAQVNASSRVNANTRVKEFKPHDNKIVLDNGKEYSYNALVLAPGFDHKSENIEGLKEQEDKGETSGVFCHIIDEKARVDRNFWHGWQHFHGDLIVYNPARPYKDEALNFYTFYYEHILRQEKVLGRASNNATVQYWTPNKDIFEFGYANEVTLEECERRGIEVHLGWELIKVHETSIGERVGTFRNVDTGKTIEKDFNQLICNPKA